MNPIQQLKNQQGSYTNRLFSQGESPDKLLQEQNLELEKIEELTEQNQSFELMSFGIKLDSKFPRGIAILEVESPGNNDIVIRCHNQFFKLHEQLNTDPIQASEISFDHMMDARIIQETIGIMRMFSQKNSQAKKLRGWLIKLQERLEQNYQHNLSYLIINDRTNFEIPWEMLELKKNNYLGANIVTVRWQDITNPEDLDDVNGLINLEVAEKKCYGKMVAYLNTKDLPSVKEEKKFLEKFNPTIYDNVRDFFNYLDAVNSEVSLVFIASHGFFGDNVSQSRLGEEDKKQQISLTQLYEYDFDFLAKGSSIVFMNTCHSGRLLQNDTLKIIDPNPQTGQYYPTGFSTFFLEKGAKGVIGTLCKVADKYAAQISHNFFEEHQKYPNLSVATILKNLRQKAANEYQFQKGNDENRYLFLFTFMYIYYGNPMTKLELMKKGGG